MDITPSYLNTDDMKHFHGTLKVCVVCPCCTPRVYMCDLCVGMWAGDSFNEARSSGRQPPFLL